MKEWITNVGYWFLALIVFLLEAILWICCGLPYRLWEKWNNEAQCLRYPGGGWGHSMKEGAWARAEKNRQDKPDRQ